MLRGDYLSAFLDLVGVIPAIGEVGDTIKSGKKGLDYFDGVADTAKVAANTADTAKILDSATDTVDNVNGLLKNTDKLDYNTYKVDGTVEKFLRNSDDPIRDMGRMSDSIAKTSPIPIPEGTKPIIEIKDGYYQMKFPWTDADGYKIESRWHTRNPGAPLAQRDSWVVKRRIPGIGAGPNHRKAVVEVLVAKEWKPWGMWDTAIKERKKGIETLEGRLMLDEGHHKA